MDKPPPLSRADIEAAIAKLQADGTKPTYENIRAHLGRGSLTTIGKFLAQISHEKNNDAQSPAAQEVLTRIWDMAVGAAKAEIIANNQETEKRLSVAVKETESLETEVARLQQELSETGKGRDEAIASMQRSLAAVEEERRKASVAADQVRTLTADVAEHQLRNAAAAASHATAIRDLEKQLRDSTAQISATQIAALRSQQEVEAKLIAAETERNAAVEKCREFETRQADQQKQFETWRQSMVTEKERLEATIAKQQDRLIAMQNKAEEMWKENLTATKAAHDIEVKLRGHIASLEAQKASTGKPSR